MLGRAVNGLCALAIGLGVNKLRQLDLGLLNGGQLVGYSLKLSLVMGMIVELTGWCRCVKLSKWGCQGIQGYT